MGKENEKVSPTRSHSRKKASLGRKERKEKKRIPEIPSLSQGDRVRTKGDKSNTGKKLKRNIHFSTRKSYLHAYYPYRTTFTNEEIVHSVTISDHLSMCALEIEPRLHPWAPFVLGPSSPPMHAVVQRPLVMDGE